jgi:hypothetical protein
MSTVLADVPEEKPQFVHRYNVYSGRYQSVCRFCAGTVAVNASESALRDEEDIHICPNDVRFPEAVKKSAA